VPHGQTHAFPVVRHGAGHAPRGVRAVDQDGGDPEGEAAVQRRVPLARGGEDQPLGAAGQQAVH